MKNAITPFKLNENVEFLENTVKNWRFGRIIEINGTSNTAKYKIYSGTDIFWAKVNAKNGKQYLETV